MCNRNKSQSACLVSLRVGFRQRIVSPLSALSLCLSARLEVVRAAAVRLLLLRLAAPFFELAAPVNVARGVLAAAGVNLEEGPHSAAGGASAVRLDGARLAVREELLHLVAVGDGALVVGARRGVDDEVHRLLDLGGARGALGFRLGVARLALALERVLVLDAAHLAVLADVKVAEVAAEPLAGVDVAPARVARVHKGGLGRVVQVVENHHRGVLRPAERVELEVVPDAQREEVLALVEKLRLHRLVRVGGFRERCDALREEGVLVLLLRVERLLALVALLAQLEVRAVDGVIAHRVGDELAAARALVREVHHDEILLHGENLLAEALHELRVEVVERAAVHAR
mmetsp:Transcript_30722/g.99956  ORF Transcript_30722/g.99956 Transcript_30722/m.99956 type:complete len:344 (-) Transcript_30722:2150-3181(-)